MVERLKEAFWASDGTLFRTEEEAIRHERRFKIKTAVQAAVLDSRFHDFGHFPRHEIGGSRWIDEVVSNLIKAGVTCQ